MNAREWTLRHAELLRTERAALADLLLSLAEFDGLAAYRELGYASLFDYLHRELGLSRGSAHYRQVATRLVAVSRRSWSPFETDGCASPP